MIVDNLRYWGLDTVRGTAYLTRSGSHTTRTGWETKAMTQQTWTKEDLERNGGHTPECEQYCDPSCPIGQEKRAEANRRAHLAQLAWSAKCEIGPVGGYSARSWCAVHRTYADQPKSGTCNACRNCGSTAHTFCNR
jgi:hypothetical protein